MFGKKKNGDADSGSTLNREETVDEYQGLDEYSALDKYIETYHDKGDVESDIEGDQEAAEMGKKSPWWKFWGKKGAAGAGGDGYVPEEWLDVDIKQGIASGDIEHRRRLHGYNEISSEKENMFLKFLGYFTGPILYGESFIYLVFSGGFPSETRRFAAPGRCAALLSALAPIPPVSARSSAPRHPQQAAPGAAAAAANVLVTRSDGARRHSRRRSP